MTDQVISKQQAIDDLQKRIKELSEKGDIVGVIVCNNMIDAIRAHIARKSEDNIVDINFNK